MVWRHLNPQGLVTHFRDVLVELSLGYWMNILLLKKHACWVNLCHRLQEELLDILMYNTLHEW